jgi:hypothetical protein
LLWYKWRRSHTPISAHPGLWYDWCVKTTVEISDSLLRDAKRYAAARELTLRQVLETGLRTLLAEAKVAKKPFRLKPASFNGDGMVKDYSWPEIRSVMYQGRGE